MVECPNIGGTYQYHKPQDKAHELEREAELVRDWRNIKMERPPLVRQFGVGKAHSVTKH